MSAGVACSSTTGQACPGVKFTDAELIGVPTRGGRPRLAEGFVELRDRRTGERDEIPTDHVVNHLVSVVRS